MTDFLERTWFLNTVQDYLVAFGAVILGILLVMIFKRTVLSKFKKRAERTSTSIDDIIVTIIENFGIPAIYLTIVYFGIKSLTLTETANDIFAVAIAIAITYLAIRFVSSAVILALQGYVRRQSNGEEKLKQIGGVILIINVMIWIIGLLFFFDNMGYDVTAVITGLGIGGIAIALAAQNILGDLFNYFVIFFDRPFEVGDFITIDDKMGVVESIGIKTTRIKSLSGEQLVFANSDLTSSRIHNYKRMQRRTVVFKIGVAYNTPYEIIKKVPSLLKTVVEEQSPVEFDRAHFAAYGDSSLDFEVVYYVLDSDFSKYMDIQQAINFRILEEFEKMGIEIPYPTRTLFVVNEQEKDLES